MQLMEKVVDLKKLSVEKNKFYLKSLKLLIDKFSQMQSQQNCINCCITLM